MSSFRDVEDSGDSDRLAEAREGERAAAKQWARTRTLTGLIADAVASGDDLTVVCADHRVSGTASAAVGDHAVLETGDRRAVVNLEGPIRFRRVPSSTGGTTNDQSHGTFLARLRTLELQNASVEVVSSSGFTIGTVVVAGSDHLVIQGDTGETLIPMSTIAFVTCDAAHGG